MSTYPLRASGLLARVLSVRDATLLRIVLQKGGSDKTRHGRNVKLHGGIAAVSRVSLSGRERRFSLRFSLNRGLLIRRGIILRAPNRTGHQAVVGLRVSARALRPRLRGDAESLTVI